MADKVEVLINTDDGLVEKAKMSKTRYIALIVVAIGFISFQMYLALVRPMDRWLQVPYHLCFGLLATFLFKPMATGKKKKWAIALSWIYDALLYAMIAYIAYYFTANLSYLQNRIYNVDIMRTPDLIAGYMMGVCGNGSSKTYHGNGTVWLHSFLHSLCVHRTEDSWNLQVQRYVMAGIR